MKAKASLAGGICSTGRLYFFFLGYFLWICVASDKQAKSLWDGPVPVVWERRDTCPRVPLDARAGAAGEEGISAWEPVRLLTVGAHLGSKPSGQVACIFMVSQTDRCI